MWAPAPFRAMASLVLASLRLALAHHPGCGYFRDHVFRIGGIGFCRGCVLTWPAFLVGLLGAWGLLHLGAHWAALGAVGLASGLPQGTTYLFRGGGTWRAFVKLVGGFGLGLLFVSLVAAPFGLAWLLAVTGALGVAFLLLQWRRVHTMLATCKACPWAMDWDHCPGFGGI